MKWVKHFEVEGRVPVTRPRKTWDETLRKCLESKVLEIQVVHSCVARQGGIR